MFLIHVQLFCVSRLEWNHGCQQGLEGLASRHMGGAAARGRAALHQQVHHDLRATTGGFQVGPVVALLAAFISGWAACFALLLNHGGEH